MLKIFRKTADNEIAGLLYASVVQQARQPEFYTELGVPDTPDGRFDMVLLHAFLLFRRLTEGAEATKDLSQAVFDLMFADMDQNLREMGVGDIGVSHRIKGMIKSFYGRASVYEQGLTSEDDQDLLDALKRNLYRKSEPAEEQVMRVAAYMQREAEHLAEQDIGEMRSGKVVFGPPLDT